MRKQGVSEVDRIGPVGCAAMVAASVVPFTGAPVWAWVASALLAFVFVPLWEEKMARILGTDVRPLLLAAIRGGDVRRRTPWDRLRRAAIQGTGCRLSPEDVRSLLRDEALAYRGELDAFCYDQGHDPATCHDEECLG